MTDPRQDEASAATGTRRSGRWQRWAPALAATVFAALPLLSHVGPLQWASLLGVAGICIGLVWHQGRESAMEAGAMTDSPDRALGSAGAPNVDLNSLLTGVLPVWLKHVESVKNQTEAAITQLVISFSSMTGQFEAAGFKGADGGMTANEDTSFSLLTLCERQLHPVIATMSRILDSKASLVSSVHDLSSATGELQNMASAVTQIAAQTNLLAINAAIEAARAGDTGRGFAVIAKEIRSLSQVSAQTGKQITDRMVQVRTIMDATVKAASAASEHDRTAIELSGSVVRDVLSHVHEMSVNAEKMRGQGNIIRNDIETLLVNLQFQDRVSQIISVIESDMSRLKATVENREPVPATEQWLAELSTLYTMNDQHQIHESRDSGPRSQKAAPATEETVFF